MKVLDLDLDYFMDEPVYDKKVGSRGRVEEKKHVESVWSKDRVQGFLENNLGLSKEKKIKGRIIKDHNEALDFWQNLITNNELEKGFEVVHVDSHADLGLGCIEYKYVRDELISVPFDEREMLEENSCKINIGNYLLFALAYRWISNIVYCSNPKGETGDIPEKLILGKAPHNKLEEKVQLNLQLRSSQEIEAREKSEEPEVPLLILPQIDHVNFKGDFDYITVAQSPNYTPQNADYILDIIREYMIEI